MRLKVVLSNSVNDIKVHIYLPNKNTVSARYYTFTGLKLSISVHWAAVLLLYSRKVPGSKIGQESE